MNRITMLVVACCLVIGTCAGLVCSALQDADVVGRDVYAFVAGLIAIAAGGTGVMIPAAWVVDRYSAAGRRERSCL